MSAIDFLTAVDDGGAVFIDLEASDKAESAPGERVVLRFTGADRVRYLNGQVSNDIRRLKGGGGSEALAACVMNAKGKMNAYCWIHATDEALYLDAEGTDEEFREALAMRLERYIIADDVELADVSQEFAILHLLGESEPVISLLPAEGEARWRKAARFGLPGRDLIVPRGQKTAWIEKLKSAGCRQAAPEEAEALRIRQGVPRWGRELDENTLPAEAGLDANAIDFHKGCYIGQEIISRIKSVGRVNWQLWQIASASPLEAGMELFNSSDKAVGRITSALSDSLLEGEFLALGYIRRGSEEEQLVAGAGRGDGQEENGGRAGLRIPVELRAKSPIS